MQVQSADFLRDHNLQRSIPPICFCFRIISTLTILPWRPQIGRVVRMYCEIRYPDGSAYALDTRSLLNRMMKQVGGKGMQIMAGTECEFYLFERDENGKPTTIPYDEAGYCDIAPLDKGENVRREICLDLEEMGIHPESSHHEQGPGQNEIDFRFDEVMPCADNPDDLSQCRGHGLLSPAV